jgi:hypothetical protein
MKPLNYTASQKWRPSAIESAPHHQLKDGYRPNKITLLLHIKTVYPTGLRVNIKQGNYVREYMVLNPSREANTV